LAGKKRLHQARKCSQIARLNEQFARPLKIGNDAFA
jgi:hypothetical protein